MPQDIIEEIEKDLLDGAANGYHGLEEDEEEEEFDLDDGDLVGHAFSRGCRMAK